MVILLRKEADGPAITGEVRYGKLAFKYEIIRLWEKTPEDLLNASLALLPLVPLTNVSASDLPGVVRQMERRIDMEAPADDKEMLWMTTLLLMGLNTNRRSHGNC